MAKFGERFLASVANPTYGQGLFDLGAQRGERRREQRQLEAIQGAAAIGNQGVAFAQAGDVEGLNRTLQEAQNALKQPGITVDTARMLQSQISQLQGLIPQTKEISTRNSVNTIMGIDGKLANKEAFKASELAKNPTMTDAEFNAKVQQLEQQKTDLLASDTLINEQYRGRTLALSQAMAAQEELEAQNWIGKNRGTIVAAVKSGNADAMTASISSAPEAIADEAQEYLDRQIRSYNETLDLQERSIAMKQAPETKSFKDQISEIGEEYDTTKLKTLNSKYEEFIKKHWNGQTWTSQEIKNRAAVLEQNVITELGRVQTAISDTEYTQKIRQGADDRREIRDITQEIRLYSPSVDAIEKEAEIMAAEDPQFENKKYENIPLEDRLKIEAEAEQRLIQEYTEQRLDVIADINPDAEIIKEYESPITAEDTSVLSLYSEEDQKVILQNYEDSYKVVPLQEMINRLEVDEEIATTTEEEKADALFEYQIRQLPYEQQLRARDERRRQNLGFFERITEKNNQSQSLLFRN
jgi:hypothetical protein